MKERERGREGGREGGREREREREREKRDRDRDRERQKEKRERETKKRERERERQTGRQRERERERERETKRERERETDRQTERERERERARGFLLQPQNNKNSTQCSMSVLAMQGGQTTCVTKMTDHVDNIHPKQRLCNLWNSTDSYMNITEFLTQTKYSSEGDRFHKAILPRQAMKESPNLGFTHLLDAEAREEMIGRGLGDDQGGQG